MVLLNFALYIHERSALPGMVTIVNVLQKFNIRCAVLGSMELSGIQNVQIVPDIMAAQNLFVQNNLQVLISDKTIDNFVNSVALVQFWQATNELYYNKRFTVPNDIDKFIVEVVKTRSYVPAAFLQNNQTYFYMYDTDNINPLIARIPKSVCSSIVPSPSVKLGWNFSSSEVLRKKWLHLTEKLRIAQDNEDEQGAWQVIINCPSSQIRAQNLIYFCMEPKGETTYAPFLQQLSQAPLKVACLGTHKHHLNNAEWHLRATLGELKRGDVNLAKKFDKVLSVVVSDKDWDPGHKFRLELIKHLDGLKNRGYELHIYGRCQKLGFKNYRGELPDQEKDDALLPYKYHLNVENHYIDNYITEKLYDSLAAECLCFYKGAPNVTQFFSKDSFVGLSGDVKADAECIKETICGGVYEKRVKSIREAKSDLLYVYGFEPRVISIMSLDGLKTFTTSEENKQSIRDQDMKQTEVSDVELEKACHQSIVENVPICLYKKKESDGLLFDKICFALARGRKGEKQNDSQSDRQIDVVMIEKVGDDSNKWSLMMYPSGAEKILINKHIGRDVMFGCNVVECL